MSQDFPISRFVGKGAKALIMLEKKALLLVKPNGDPDLPGGRVEEDESRQSALHREIMEETGLRVSILGPIAEWSFMKNAGLRITGVTYFCVYSGGQIILSNEHSGYFWADLDKVWQLDWKRPFLGENGQERSNMPQAFHPKKLHFAKQEPDGFSIKNISA